MAKQRFLSFLLLAVPAMVGCSGTDGRDGKACTISTSDAGVTVMTCPDGTKATLSGGTVLPAVDGGATNCTIQAGVDGGPSRIVCPDGTTVVVGTGAPGAPGTPGANGTNGTSCTITTADGGGTSILQCSDGTSMVLPNDTDDTGLRVTEHHGISYLMSTGEFADGAKSMVNATITAATADVAGVVTVKFSVKNSDGSPVVKLGNFNANIVKLVPASATNPVSQWVPYIYRTRTSGTASALQGSRENNGTLTNNNDGTYTYVFKTNLTTAVMGTTPIAYQRNLTHRIAIMLGGHSGPTASATFDFVPDGTAVASTRNLVETATCQNCHGPLFDAHGGDRLTVETCVTCHNPSTTDTAGQTMDMTVMIHKIHAGGELASIPGPDGIVWDNPATAVDESADNGSYVIGTSTWWKAEFPAVLDNCQACHQGKGAQVNNWKSVPSRVACGSCHDTVNFTTGIGHDQNGAPGIQTDDSACAACHTATTGAAAIPVVHDWTTKDPRKIPEYTVDLSLSPPANGTHYVAGEAPLVSVVIKSGGVPIDHTAVVEGPAEGCILSTTPPLACTNAADTTFATSNLFVHGPRHNRNPVLTTAAHVAVIGSAEPYDLSATGAKLEVTFDGGEKVVKRDSEGGDVSYAAKVSVSIPTTGTTFANLAAATAAEVVKWLNANTAFAARGIAYLDGGKPAIRSRNLGETFSIQLSAGAVTTAVFGGDVTLHTIGSSTPSNKLAKRTATGAVDDPKATRTADKITYQLDPVDDLQPGTYVVSVEIGNRGRVDDTVFGTPSVAWTTFQVGTATAEKLTATGCDKCHQGPDGRGFVLDYPRHNKHFGSDAIDQCGACHDYQPQVGTGEWSGAVQISKRVHAVHNGANLTYPNDTVAHADTVPGRNWDITFPQDIRNCQACHVEGTSSGTWKTHPNRAACWGCHDSDAAQAHIRLMTFDPTPANPWSGDEQESCSACH
jgi:OmcA/MtrC family decaheme c-type cytochrome